MDEIEIELDEPRSDDFATRALTACRSAASFQGKAYIAGAHAVDSQGFSLDAFKSRLVVAHRAGELTLAAINLVDAADPGMVRSSEIDCGGAWYHLIRT